MHSFTTVGFGEQPWVCPLQLIADGQTSMHCMQVSGAMQPVMPGPSFQDTAAYLESLFSASYDMQPTVDVDHCYQVCSLVYQLGTCAVLCSGCAMLGILYQKYAAVTSLGITQGWALSSTLIVYSLALQTPAAWQLI